MRLGVSHVAKRFLPCLVEWILLLLSNFTSEPHISHLPLSIFTFTHFIIHLVSHQLSLFTHFVLIYFKAASHFISNYLTFTRLTHIQSTLTSFLQSIHSTFTHTTTTTLSALIHYKHSNPLSFLHISPFTLTPHHQKLSINFHFIFTYFIHPLFFPYTSMHLASADPLCRLPSRFHFPASAPPLSLPLLRPTLTFCQASIRHHHHHL